MQTRIDQMFEELTHAPEEVLPSKFWTELNGKNIQQLESDGYENFKRTLARNYFTWVSGITDWAIRSQLKYLFLNLPFSTFIPVAIRTLFTNRHDGLSWRYTISYNLLSRLIWAYALTVDKKQRLYRLNEPDEGHPLPVYYAGNAISQDLGNAFLEYQAVMDTDLKPDSLKTVMELGAGYGRTAYVYLKLNPELRYIIVDIPPALYVAERYLSSQFPDRKVFKFRPFDSYATIAQEFEQAQIAFLLPHQLEQLPNKSVNLFINISSLHEMLPDQVRYYLQQVDRLTQGYFYMKQWKQWYNNVDELQITQDYPIPATWAKQFWRECRVQVAFFEALFTI
jgi:putative sugar O-methyltransferase